MGESEHVKAEQPRRAVRGQSMMDEEGAWMNRRILPQQMGFEEARSGSAGSAATFSDGCGGGPDGDSRSGSSSVD